MELLKFIIFASSFYFLNLNEFLNFILLIGLIKLNYNSNLNINLLNLDPIICFMYIINLFLNLVIYIFKKFYLLIHKNFIVKFILNIYNFFNLYFIKFKNQIIYIFIFNPIKFYINNYLIGSLSNNSLNSELEINVFLDSLSSK